MLIRNRTRMRSSFPNLSPDSPNFVRLLPQTGPVKAQQTINSGKHTTSSLKSKVYLVRLGGNRTRVDSDKVVCNNENNGHDA